MKKTFLENTIEKYHLNGIVERIKISIKDKTLSTQFISTNKNLVGKITASGIELKDCEFGVYDTSALLKLIGITNDFITLDVEAQGNIANKLLIADNEYNLEYALADTMLTPIIPIIEEPEYNISSTINNEFIAKFLKAKKALDTEIFTIEQSADTDGNATMLFTLGGIEKYTNKIIFALPLETSSVPGNTAKFPIVEFAEILSANKETMGGMLYVSEDGLLKIEFNEEKISSSYILVGKE